MLMPNSLRRPFSRYLTYGRPHPFHVADEKDEGRRGFAGLGQVVELGPPAADQGRLVPVEHRPHGPVEFPRAHADLAFLPDSFGDGQHLAHALVLHGRQVQHRHVGADAQFLFDVLAQGGHVALGHQVHLVDRDQKRGALLVQVGDQPLVLDAHAAGGVDDHHGHVGPLGAAQGLVDAVALQAVGDAGAACARRPCPRTRSACRCVPRSRPRRRGWCRPPR